MCKIFGRSDMAYFEIRDMCREVWSRRLNYSCIDSTKNRNAGKYRIFIENKNTYIKCVPEMNSSVFCNLE